MTEAVSKLSGVSSAYTLTGTFDVIALVEAQDFKALSELVLAKIHTSEGAVRTETAKIYK